MRPIAITIAANTEITNVIALLQLHDKSLARELARLQRRVVAT
jgi:hypothetical protein